MILLELFDGIIDILEILYIIPLRGLENLQEIGDGIYGPLCMEE